MIPCTEPCFKIKVKHLRGQILGAVCHRRFFLLGPACNVLLRCACTPAHSVIEVTSVANPDFGEGKVKKNAVLLDSLSLLARCAPRIFPWKGGGCGADPEAIYNLFLGKNYFTKIRL
jgi:hypothetical protein